MSFGATEHRDDNFPHTDHYNESQHTSGLNDYKAHNDGFSIRTAIDLNIKTVRSTMSSSKAAMAIFYVGSPSQ